MAKFFIAGQLEFELNSKLYNIAIGYESTDISEPKLSTRVYVYNEEKKDGELLDEKDIPENIKEVSKVYTKGFSDGAAYTYYILNQDVEQDDTKSSKIDLN